MNVPFKPSGYNCVSPSIILPKPERLMDFLRKTFGVTTGWIGTPMDVEPEAK